MTHRTVSRLWILGSLVPMLLMGQDAGDKIARERKESKAKAAKVVDSAKRGDPEALYTMGVVAGMDRQHDKESAELYRQAAEKGHVKAQSALAMDYYYGVGVNKDYAEAAKWARLASDKGDATAMSILGLAYIYGKGLPKDPAEGIKWFKKSAELGEARAHYGLAWAYLAGTGVEKDLVEAYAWFSVYANYDQMEDKVRLSLSEVKSKLTPEEWKRAKARAAGIIAKLPPKK